MSKNQAVEAPKYEPSVSLRMTKDQAKSLVIGEKVSATVAGTVKGIRECYDDKDMYDVDLKPASVSGVSTTNSADKAYKKMTTK